MFLILIIFIFCLFYTFFSISRGWSSLTEIIFTVICSIWLSFYCFNTLRIPIQKHVRIILEMNYELDFDDQDEHKLSIINRIPIVFLFWIIFFSATQATYILIDLYFATDPNYLREYLSLCTK